MTAPIGQVTSLFDPAVSARVLFGPDGVVIPTPGTLTRSVNEGIAYAIANNWPFKSLAHEILFCTDGIRIPPAAFADIDLGGTEFSISGTNQPAFSINSFNGGRFVTFGHWEYSGTNGSVAMVMNPSAADPKYGQKIIQNAEIDIPDIQVAGVNVGAGIQIFPSGDIIQNRLRFRRINGWDGVANRIAHGIQVVPPAEGCGFNENIITVAQCFGCSISNILVGSPDPKSVYLSDNEWDVMLNTVSGSIGTLIDSYSSHDEWRYSATAYAGSSFAKSITFRAGANNNSYKARQLPYAVNDLGAGNRAV